MITEDYVSFETAKLLKEKGFDECCSHFYRVDGEHEYCCKAKLPRLTNNDIKNHDDWVNRVFVCTCPTLQMAMKWLREQNRIISIVHGYITNKYRIIITQSNELDITNLGNTLYCSNDYDYFSYEEACEAAIKYCLENLI